MTALTSARKEFEVDAGGRAQRPSVRRASCRGCTALSLLLFVACVGTEPDRPATSTAKVPTSDVAARSGTSVETTAACTSMSNISTPACAVAAEPSSGNANQPGARPSLGIPESPAALRSDADSFEAFRLALTGKDFRAAERWLTANTVKLDSSVNDLATAVVSLGLNKPDHALASLKRVDTKVPVATWLDELMVQGHALSDGYVSHLATLKRKGKFSDSLRVAWRLFEDSRFAECEAFVNRAFGLADSFETRGQVRFLRARLRLAQNRPQQAIADLRWLALSNPQHSDSERAFALLSHEPFGALSADDNYLRANQLASHGLVESTDAAAESLRKTIVDGSKLGDLEYLRGLARYRRRLFAEAIPPLDRAVEMGSHKADHARYLAARATARSGNPKAAIERFKPIARSFPPTKTVTNAAFHIAREYSLAGDWEQAARAYGEFQARFPNHEYAKLVDRDLLPVWFAGGHYKRVVYWARQLREKNPDDMDAPLLRNVEALALLKLGHTDFAKQLWLGIAQSSPLGFSGLVARRRLAALGLELKGPLNAEAAQRTRLNVALPPFVTQLDALGFSRQAEFAMRRQETSVAEPFAPNADAALCEAYASLRGGRRRFELGFEAVKRRGFHDSPGLADAWLWDCYYPTPFSDSVRRHTTAYPVSPALVYAVMRQESAFLETVESHAGARGLMQVIDPTARRIASELKRPYNAEDLNDPDHNIEFGTFYLEKLQRYFSHPALVAAAYNAGPEAAARWFAAGRSLPLEVFVLSIPYEETRTYIQRVLANLVVYQTLVSDSALDVSLEFAQALDAHAALPDVSLMTPDDFY